MIKYLIFSLILGFGFSCNFKTEKQIVAPELADSLFALKNLSNTDFMYLMKYDDSKLFLDSTHKVEFTALDTSYKRKILVPILKQDLELDAEYVMSYMNSYFIAKQNKVGPYQPLIIWTSGDDYTSLILALVDSAFNPVSHFILKGGFQTGPYEINDSLTSWGEEKFADLNGNTINSYSLFSSVWTDERNDSVFVDSIIYKSEILDNGQIKTERKDSVRLLKRIHSYK